MWNVLCTTTVVFVLFVLAGGVIFFVLEASNLMEIQKVKKNITVPFEELHLVLLEDGFHDDRIARVVKLWDDDMYPVYFDNKTMKTQEGWTYSNAFSFAFHLCSTIGYGNISPVTPESHLLVIIYSIIGIPLHIIFYKSFGNAFVEAFQELLAEVEKKEEAARRIIGALIRFGFFAVWWLVFFIIPAAVFMYTEHWGFIDGLYYGIITMTTVGLGDYVAGHQSQHYGWYIHLYRTVILIWMLYGMAFVTMAVDILTSFYSTNLLFILLWKKGKPKVQRVYVDIEKLDIHFRLLRAEGIKHDFSVWGMRKETMRAWDFQLAHLGYLTSVAERTQGALISLLSNAEESRFKDAFPVKVPSDEEQHQRNVL